MLWTPQKGRLLHQHNGPTIGSLNLGTAVTTGATSGTFGTDVELIASTNFDSYLMYVMACDYALAATACEGMLTLLIGTDPEEILVDMLLMGACGGPNVSAIPASLGKTWVFPIYIPSGSRIAARATGIRVSTAFRVMINLFGGHGMPPFRVGQKIVTYPDAASVTEPRGDPLTPGASGAEGAWTEVVASTSEPHFAVVPSFQSETDTSMTQSVYAFDIGVGAATEEEIAQSYLWVSSTGEKMDGPYPQIPTFVDIPSGTRLAVRASCSTALDTAYGSMLHCVS